MKVKLIKKDSTISKKDYELYKTFVEYIYEKFPLNKDLNIVFLSERIGNMSTGSSNWGYGEIKILTKNRLNRDILRTIAHEWLHQYQKNVLNRELGADIGGKNEDEANAYAGRLVKMFERDYPDLEQINYE